MVFQAKFIDLIVSNRVERKRFSLGFRGGGAILVPESPGDRAGQGSFGKCELGMFFLVVTKAVHDSICTFLYHPTLAIVITRMFFAFCIAAYSYLLICIEQYNPSLCPTTRSTGVNSRWT